MDNPAVEYFQHRHEWYARTAKQELQRKLKNLAYIISAHLQHALDRLHSLFTDVFRNFHYWPFIFQGIVNFQQ